MDTKNLLAAVRFRDDKLSKVNLFETANFFLDIYCLRPGQSQPVHSHAENDKVYCVLRGEARVTVGEEVRTLGANDATLALAGEPHGIENASTGDLVCLVLMAPRPPSRSKA